MSKREKIDYKEIIRNLEIKSGDIVLLTSNLTFLAYDAAVNKEVFDENFILDTVISKLGSTGTLLLPVYNWDFCHGVTFDYKNTQSKTGHLGNLALKRDDFKRTKNPIYSFAVWGKDKDYLCSIDPVISLGKDSVFGYLHRVNAKNVVLDVDISDHYTICHYVEQVHGVPYRYNKYFKADYIDEYGNKSRKTYSMSVRYLELDVTSDTQIMYEELLKQNIAYERHIGHHVISYINMGDSVPVMEKDVLENNAVGQAQYKGQFEKKLPLNEEMYKIIKELFPINRSLSGNGNRDTLKYIKENYLGELNIKEYSIKDNPETFDWKTPYEWNINDAYIEDENGNKIIDFKKNNLHILGYSEPVDITIPFSELDNHLYSLENDIDAVPYTTSYYKKRWGFCLSHKQREELRKNPDKLYHVVIDSSINENGSITYGELVINGYTDDEILISTYICHPSMTNDNLSGIAAAVAAAKYIYALLERKYTYRIIFIPETIGALIYLKENITHLQKYVKVGFVLSCIGDNGDYSCVHTPYNNTYTDKIVTHVLKYITDNPKEYSYLERGSDERQFCAPLVNLPVCTLSRTKFAKFKEYHTSNDNLDFVTAAGIGGGIDYICQCINILENNEYYKIKTIGEPQLGKYGLYPTISQKGSAAYTRNMTNIIAYLNGKNSILDIAEILNMKFTDVLETIKKLKENNLIYII
ncbi:MAG TPA: DUF4910 domain-containing protein [Candidatus Mucispirillum faecigallinarum]|uniref:Aminoglycoside N(3)-acetyltransferase n=1 Tax=Candidatus Mucispirillum faecigallinarum TaxID=2838699 RepID=A0A9D2KCG6_9BACT|nr:DUF4910 domain-containing protein [Candidatus Mucispirillum faecigallinarum]